MTARSLEVSAKWSLEYDESKNFEVSSWVEKPAPLSLAPRVEREHFPSCEQFTIKQEKKYQDLQQQIVRDH